MTDIVHGRSAAFSFNEWHWAHFSKSLWTSLFFSCVILLLMKPSLFYSSIGHKMHPDSLFVKSLPCSLSLFYCFHHHRSLVCLRERLGMCLLYLSYTVCVHIHTAASPVDVSSLLFLSWKHWREPVAERVLRQVGVLFFSLGYIFAYIFIQNME